LLSERDERLRYHRSLLAGARVQPIAHRTGHAVTLPTEPLRPDETAAIGLSETPCCRHPVRILTAHKAAKL